MNFRPSLSAIEHGQELLLRAEETKRGKVLQWLLPPRRITASQFTPVQRLCADASLAACSVVAACVLGGVAGRSPSDNMAWLLLAVPMSIILGTRKHEVRQLNIYKDQCTWLRLHEAEVRRIAETGQLGGGRLTEDT